MAGRSSVWSDAEVAELAQSSFVCATDEVWRLQRDDDRECRFFQTTVAGKPGALEGSHQGIYIVAPSGRLLARRNALAPDQALALLREGLDAWKNADDDTRRPAEPSTFLPEYRWEQSYPEGGLVLSVILRDLPPPDEASSEPSATSRPAGRNAMRFNRDHAWFHRDEVSDWIPADPVVGAKRILPKALAQRLARFHLVDNARGQVGPFAPEEIEEATFTIEVVAREDAMLHLRIDGRTRASSDGVWKMGDNDWKLFPSRPRSIETRCVGEATFDLDARRFITFELAAIGESHGGVGLNGRGEPGARGRIGYWISLAPDTPRHRVAPAFVDVYDVSWIGPNAR
ncbi:MAG: hypothetical protein KDC38_11400 [Planctomycetes bacterium]|nr:hypothetical protein [Planctomycetota bacterium]